MKFTLSPGTNLGQTLKSELMEILDSMNSKLDKTLKTVAEAGIDKAQEMAASRLNRTAQQYQDALHLEQIGPNKYAIVLDASAAHLEEGYGPYSIRDALLKSEAIVKTGKRAGQKWVRTSKSGFKYAVVPFDQSNQAAANPSHPLNQSKIRQGQDNEQTMGDLMSDMKQMIKKAKIGGITKDASGAPILGKVATIKSTNIPGDMSVTKFDGTDRSSNTFNLGSSMAGTQNTVNPLLNGLTKYQYEVKKKDGGSQIKSAYMTYRVVSEKSTGWTHPGFSGAKIFPDLEQWADTTMSRMIEEALSKIA